MFKTEDIEKHQAGILSLRQELKDAKTDRAKHEAREKIAAAERALRQEMRDEAHRTIDRLTTTLATTKSAERGRVLEEARAIADGFARDADHSITTRCILLLIQEK